jgi:hypothetical protein
LGTRAGRPAQSGVSGSPTKTPQLSDTAADPHRNPTDETAHSGTLVMRVKDTENSRSAAYTPVSWAVGGFLQVSALGMTDLLKSGLSANQTTNGTVKDGRPQSPGLRAGDHRDVDYRASRWLRPGCAGQRAVGLCHQRARPGRIAV